MKYLILKSLFDFFLKKSKEELTKFFINNLWKIWLTILRIKKIFLENTDFLDYISKFLEKI